MSHVTIVNRSQLFAAATAITAAVGFLTVSATARAGPPLPLAPPCSQYGFNGDFPIRQGGEQVFFTSTGPATVGGRAVMVYGQNNGQKTLGNVNGGLQGRNVTSP
jgi:hypothetical protein